MITDAPVPHLLFSLDDMRCAIEACFTLEMFRLPELTAAAEMPPHIRGLLNLRGQVIPVMDLRLRLGWAARPSCLEDTVIILERDGTLLGMIVSEVHDVRMISAEEVESLEAGRGEDEGRTRLIPVVAKTGDGIVMVLNVAALFSLEWEALSEPAASEARPPSPNALIAGTPAFPEVVPADRALLRERAAALSRPLETADHAGLVPLVVVLLNRECFGVPLALVVEFTDALKFTPLPSCPDHVTGVTNLRGEILTLVDIRPVLRMPLASPGGSSQVMVVEVGDIRAGILVDQVLDITYFRPADVIPLPSAVKSANEESVEGTILYRERVLSVLSIPRIFARQDWIVNQAA